MKNSSDMSLIASVIMAVLFVSGMMYIFSAKNKLDTDFAEAIVEHNKKEVECCKGDKVKKLTDKELEEITEHMEHCNLNK